MDQAKRINKSVAGQEWKTNYSWDFFICHPGPDKDHAQILYNALTPPAKVFLDVVSLVPGDNFDASLPEALKASLISVILISPNTEKAYYEKEEIALAIDMSRADPNTHRVVPVYINTQEASLPVHAPYGLKRKHSLFITKPDDFAETGKRLLLTLDVMKKQEIKKDKIVEQFQEAVFKINNPCNKTDVVAGFNLITSFIRIPLIVLSVIFIITIIMLAATLIIKPEQKGLVVGVLTSFSTLTLFGIFWLISKSLSHAPQIAQGKINGN